MAINRPGENATNSQFRRLTLVVAAGTLVFTAFLALTCMRSIGSNSDSKDPEIVTAFGELEGITAQDGEGLLRRAAPLVAVLAIPKLGVETQVVTKTVDSNGSMESPDGPSDVVWYDFSAVPGTVGNAVFSGHVDFADFGPAVFWGLRELVEGDLIQVVLEDGTDLRYRVVGMASVAADASHSEIVAIVGRTEHEVITLITCDGTFDEATQTYDKRLIVRAERISGGAEGVDSK